jgi:transcriptional regulator with GAF, ATPase, and Fis domain
MLSISEINPAPKTVGTPAKQNGRRAMFERLLGQLSADLVRTRERSLDSHLCDWLEPLADELDADYAEIGLFPVGGPAPGQPCSCTIWPEAEQTPYRGSGAVWLHNKLAKGGTFAVADLDELPLTAEKDRVLLQRAGIRSVCWVPMISAKSLVGWFAVASKNRSVAWPELTLRRCRLVADVLCSAIVSERARAEIRSLRCSIMADGESSPADLSPTHTHREIIGDSAALQAALSKVDQVAPTNATVLITGETGTGKELMARAIHDCSARRGKAMVNVNCAALPSSLVEAELFGREKGAFTGALSREAGRFEIADGSTLLLDEIGELSLELQAKLLRVLQEGEFERLGSSKTLRTDVRVLAATNRNLAQAVEEKTFREDLYYRLNVFPIDVPPLRERIDDIPRLVWAFVQEFSQAMGKNIETIPVKSMKALQAHCWPGNVREVRNVIERAMIVSKGPILEVEVPRTELTLPEASQQLADVERRHIKHVVESRRWRIRGVGGAAEVLGLKPTTLEARMKKLGIVRNNGTNGLSGR